MDTNQVEGQRLIYGTVEKNGLVNPAEYHKQFSESKRVNWDCKELEKIIRLRLVSDPGYPEWDITYCHGILKDGTNVIVGLPFGSLPKKNYKKSIKAWAKHSNICPIELGIFKYGVISTLI
jgi:hypothetical protein